MQLGVRTSRHGVVRRRGSSHWYETVKSAEATILLVASSRPIEKGWCGWGEGGGGVREKGWCGWGGGRRAGAGGGGGVREKGWCGWGVGGGVREKGWCGWGGGGEGEGLVRVWGGGEGLVRVWGGGEGLVRVGGGGVAGGVACAPRA